jgi:hypothetical protein
MGLAWNTPGPRPIIAAAGEAASAVPNCGAAANMVLRMGWAWNALFLCEHPHRIVFAQFLLKEGLVWSAARGMSG